MYSYIRVFVYLCNCAFVYLCICEAVHRRNAVLVYLGIGVFAYGCARVFVKLSTDVFV